MPFIELEWYEEITSKVIGAARSIESEGRRHRVREPESGNLANHVEAAGGEQATAKFLGRFWCGGVNTFKGADVWPNIEVRTTPYVTGHLIVRANTPDDRVCVLVRGSMPKYEVVGWIYAADAKQDKWKANPNGDGECWMVPADALCTEFRRKETNGLSSVPPTDPR